MIGWILGGLIVTGMVAINVNEGQKKKEDFLRKLEEDKAGNTYFRIGEKSGELCTFKSQQDAIEHPQEIVFGEDACGNVETILVVKSKKTEIEVWNGKEHETISNTQLIKIKSEEGNDTYVYIKVTGQ